MSCHCTVAIIMDEYSAYNLNRPFQNCQNSRVCKNYQKNFQKKTFTNLSPPFYVWHKKSDFPAKILIATWCNHIGISCRIIFISDIECFFMSERVYQLEFTIKYNFRHVYLICCNFIFGGKIRFFMSDVEWRWQVGKSFFSKINLCFSSLYKNDRILSRRSFL